MFLHLFKLTLRVIIPNIDDRGYDICGLKNKNSHLNEKLLTTKKLI